MHQRHTVVDLFICDCVCICMFVTLSNGPQQHLRCTNHAITRKQSFNSDTINFEILTHCACSALTSTFSACTPRNNNLLLIIISFSSSLTHSLSLVETRSPPCLLLPWSLLLSVYAMLSSFFRPHQQLLLLSLSLPSSQMKALEMASTICLYGLCLVLLFKVIVYLFSGERGRERGRS